MNKLTLFILSLLILSSIGYSTVTDQFIANYSSPYSLSQSNDNLLNNVSVYNSTWLEFDGVNDIVTLTPTNLSNFTIIASFKKLSGGNQNILFYGGKLLRMNDAGIRFFINTSGGATFNSNFNLNNTWVTYGFSWNSTNYSEYHNGKYNFTGSLTSGLVNSLTANYGSFSGVFFNGSVMETRIYNKVLSNYQVALLFNESKLGNDLGLRVPILEYHSISPNNSFSQGIYWQNSSVFNDTMDYLYSHNFSTITFKDYYNWKQGTFTMPKKPVIISFDDGRKEPFLYAYPKMNSLGFVGVAAITNLTLSQVTCSDSDYRMCISDLNNLIANGWEIASHTVNHTITSTFLQLTYDERIYQYNISKILIDSVLGYNTTSFIFPGNDQNITLRSECNQFYNICLGDDSSVSTPKFGYKSTNITGDNGLTRIFITNSTTLLDFKNINVEDDIVTLYKFAESSGTTLYDTSGNNNHGTISGATWRNDSIKIKLERNYDYSLSSGSFLLLNGFYDKSYVMADFDCVVPTEDLSITSSTNICDGHKYIKNSTLELYNLSYYGFYNLSTDYTSLTTTKAVLRNNATINFQTIAYRSFKIINDTIRLNLTSLIYPYSQVYNSTSVTPQCENGDCNVSLGVGNRSLVFQRATENEPHPSSIATTINDMTISLTSNTYSVNCSGTGEHTHTGLDYLGRTIYVYHDSVLVTTLYNEASYTASSCSTWKFTSSDRENFNSEVKPNLVTAYLAIASLMSLVIIVAMLGGIIYLIVQFKNGRIEMTFDNVKFYLYGGAILLMIAIFVVTVIVIIISVGSSILPGG